MSRRVAGDEAILEAARRILARETSVQTQRRLGRLVAQELRREDAGVGLTAERVRRLLARAGFVKLEYRARKGEREKVLHKCPVCWGELRRVKNQTLFGGEVTLVLRCGDCGYWTGKEKRVPTYYVFHYTGPGSGEGPSFGTRA